MSIRAYAVLLSLFLFAASLSAQPIPFDICAESTLVFVGTVVRWLTVAFNHQFRSPGDARTARKSTSRCSFLLHARSGSPQSLLRFLHDRVRFARCQSQPLAAWHLLLQPPRPAAIRSQAARVRLDSQLRQHLGLASRRADYLRTDRPPAQSRREGTSLTPNSSAPLWKWAVVAIQS